MDDDTKKEIASMVAQMMGKMREGEGDEVKPPLRSKEVQAMDLRDVLRSVQRPCPFQVGDLVEQDSTVRGYRYPGDGVVAIVTQVGGLNVRAQSTDGPYRREDIVILCLVDGRWMEFAVESWRFKKAQITEETKH